jgi:hypothetical protein
MLKRFRLSVIMVMSWKKALFFYCCDIIFSMLKRRIKFQKENIGKTRETTKIKLLREFYESESIQNSCMMSVVSFLQRCVNILREQLTQSMSD